jgi:pilus assembly protein CpaC
MDHQRVKPQVRARWQRASRHLLVGLALALLVPATVGAQEVLTQPEQVVTVVRGTSALLRLAGRLERVSIADTAIAEAVVVTPEEVLINGVSVGTTSLMIWRAGDRARLYNVEVVADLNALQRQLEALYPNDPITVSTVAGNMVVLAGTVTSAAVVRGAESVAGATGATVVNNLQMPEAAQILLHVRFAEVNRLAMRSLGSDLLAINPQDAQSPNDSDTTLIETLSEGIIHLLLGGKDFHLEGMIKALKSSGEYRSLAEPNLIAADGKEATFLAGGEFPFPVLQSANSNAVTIVWKEYGVRLSFTPTVTDAGNIRLRVAPEVSSLDFSNGLTLGGFQIPSLLTRRATTEVELAPGQNLAIAGLLDNTMLEDIDKLPILGEIPILGRLFQSRDIRQNRTELLVIVTPHFVSPTDQAPPVPTGEPADWRWLRGMRPDTTTVPGA